MTAPRADSALAALLLAQRLVDAGARPLKASEFWRVIDAVDDPSELLGLDAHAISRTTGADEDLSERVAGLLGAGTPFAFALDQAQQAGVGVLSALADEYPSALRDRLGRGAPPLLYVVGDPALLSADLLGVVGSRDVTEQGADVARQVAAQAVQHGHGVVSGGAKGVDRIAMVAALEAGGVGVRVLADSLMRTVRDPLARRAVGEGRLCLCTPYNPSAGFSVPNAMGRNKLIYALSQATMVVAADADRGGTWAGAVEALRRRTAPVVVWADEGAGDGNARLVALGATPAHRISDLYPLPTLDRPPQPPESEAEQLALDVRPPAAAR